MNKTIIININGIVFHIEEDAYEILKAYMNDVQRHFMNSADSLEITTDIENRIAEMFNEILLREGKQVVVLQDVKAVVEQMGSVADFEAEEDNTAGAQPHQAFGSHGTANRRLFRDPDDHLVAGVCSGIANYFDFSPVWVRLLFALSFAFAGSGLILYVILWIVVPKAVTRADRMAMKGERLDLQGFKNNFEEELNTVKVNLSNFSNEAKPFVYKTRDFAGDFFQHFGTFLGGTGKVMGKLIAIMILIACFGSIIALIIGVVMAFAFNDKGIYHIFPLNITSYEVNKIFFVCLILMVIIPLLAIILTVLRLVFNTKSISRTTGSTLLLGWIVALSVVIYYAAKISSEFRVGAGFSQTISLKPVADSTYHLRLNDLKYLTAEDSTRLRIKESFNGRVILDDDDDNNSNMPDKNIDIRIEKSDVAQPVLVESFSARGKSYEDALSNARNISYHFVQEGATLKFNRRLEKLDDRYWRAPGLKLTLKIPLNYKVVIDDSVDRFVRDIDSWACKEVNKTDDLRKVRFVMTDNGLQCKVDTLELPRTTKRIIKLDTTIKVDTTVISE
jgi:phage shock protein PspC (stress-responsive transcriptional regulator)